MNVLVFPLPRCPKSHLHSAKQLSRLGDSTGTSNTTPLKLDTEPPQGSGRLPQSCACLRHDLQEGDVNLQLDKGSTLRTAEGGASQWAGRGRSGASLTAGAVELVCGGGILIKTGRRAAPILCRWKFNVLVGGDPFHPQVVVSLFQISGPGSL